LKGAKVEGIAIPEAVPVKGVMPEAEVIKGTASEPAVLAPPKDIEEVRDEALPETSIDAFVRSPEIQDAEPIRSAPMSETATASRDGLEMLADDLINPRR
jgi:hypothetical protein